MEQSELEKIAEAMTVAMREMSGAEIGAATISELRARLRKAAEGVTLPANVDLVVEPAFAGTRPIAVVTMRVFGDVA